VLGATNGDAIEQEWIVWRLVLSGTATLAEIERDWSLDDLLRANYALTYQQACQVEAS
jgi:hypothetical protein